MFGDYMLNFDLRPILIFWEVTRACPLKCKHCRADAIIEPLPGELSTDEGIQFIESLKEFGKPYPILIFTGGDPLMRDDILILINTAVKNGLKVGLAPSISDKLDIDLVRYLSRMGVRYVSISLDGAFQQTHDIIRGIKGHFVETLNKIKLLKEAGFITQINTVVSRKTVRELPYMVRLLHKLGINIWEVFFLIHVGRGTSVEDLNPSEYEDVLHFLFEVTRYGLEVRTVEAPFYRRIVLWRGSSDSDLTDLNINNVAKRFKLGKLYISLTTKLLEVMGEPIENASTKIARTRDGSGVIFVSYNGDIYPSGFAPYKLGNVLMEGLVNVYRNHPILKSIRRGSFKGRCGYCEFRDVCGGSRARAYAMLGDILHEDPACVYQPNG